MKLTTLIFDIDGTLAETEEEHRCSFNQAFKQVGLSWYWSRELYGNLLAITGGKERIRYFVEHHSPSFNKPDHLYEYIIELHKLKTDIYLKKLNSGCIPLRVGVSRLIAEARKSNIRLAIATTTTHSNVVALLEKSLASNSVEWFDVIAAGDSVANKKPASDVYQFVLKHLDECPQSCIAIEDSENGLRSALQAGISTVVTTSEYTQNQDFNGAMLVVNQLGDSDNPSTVIDGNLNMQTYVNVDLLEHMSETNELTC